MAELFPHSTSLSSQLTSHITAAVRQRLRCCIARCSGKITVAFVQPHTTHAHAAVFITADICVHKSQGCIYLSFSLVVFVGRVFIGLDANTQHTRGKPALGSLWTSLVQPSLQETHKHVGQSAAILSNFLHEPVLTPLMCSIELCS